MVLVYWRIVLLRPKLVMHGASTSAVLLKYEASLMTTWWEHSSHDKPNRNRDSTNTFHTTTHETNSFFICKIVFDVTSLFAIRLWHNA